MSRRGIVYLLLKRLCLKNYLSAWLILGLDMTVSVCSSLMGILLCALLVSHTFGIPFFVWWSIGAAVASISMFFLLHTYRIIVRYSTLWDIEKLGFAAFGKTVLLGVLSLLFAEPGHLLQGLLLLDFLLTFCFLVLVRVVTVTLYDMIQKRGNTHYVKLRILVYGTGNKSVSQVIRLNNSRHYEVVGFLLYGKCQEEYTLTGYKVYYFETERDLCRLRDRYGISGVLFSYYADAQDENERLLRYCPQCKLQTLITPTIDEIYDGQIPKPIRKIRIEDLLGRPEIKISLDEIIMDFRDKTILVTGAAGSIGSELCRQLSQFGIKEIIAYDNAETPLHNLWLEFGDKHPELRFIPVIGDVRIPSRLDYVFRMYRPQVVFHAAAYKHVPLMEENPCEAVLVNVVGSRNVADKCIEYDVEKMVMISTDKAVNPTNIMGCTKRLAEIYVQSLGLAVAARKMKGKTRFITTRFGNVLGSNGSVVPRFKEEIENGGPVTVTHPEITRFFMTIPEACRLVIEATTVSSGNEICVFDMGEPVKIVHLAETMIRLCNLQVGKDIKIEYTGLRPGEKLYEEVLASAENTLPTSHDRIRIAKVRECEYENTRKTVEELETLSRSVNILDMVRLMKRTVPEFKSENSRFRELDDI